MNSPTESIGIVMCVELEKLRASHMQECRECQASFLKAIQLWREMMQTGESVLPPDLCPEIERIVNGHRGSCKKCQDNRARLKRMEEEGSLSPSHQEIIEARKRAAKKKKCFFPDNSQCRGGIIKAHSVQHKQLEKIARNQHVYHFKGSYDNLLRHDGVFKATLLGLNEASTFTGFCSFHDSSLFAPVEQGLFKLDREKVFLLSYRAICLELFNQEIWLDHFPMFRKLPRGLPLPFYVMTQNEISRDESQLNWSLQGLRSMKLSYDNVIHSGDFSDMNYYSVEIDTKLPFLCSGVTSPQWDFHGRRIQGFSEFKAPAALTFSTVIAGSRSVLLFGWLGSKIEINQFLKSLHMHPDDEILEAVRRFVFELVENVYFEPEWWEANAEIRRFLEDRIMTNFKKRFRRSPQQLISDNYRILAGKVISLENTIGL